MDEHFVAATIIGASVLQNLSSAQKADTSGNALNRPRIGIGIGTCRKHHQTGTQTHQDMETQVGLVQMRLSVMMSTVITNRNTADHRSTKPEQNLKVWSKRMKKRHEPRALNSQVIHPNAAPGNQ